MYHHTEVDSKWIILFFQAVVAIVCSVTVYQNAVYVTIPLTSRTVTVLIPVVMVTSLTQSPENARVSLVCVFIYLSVLESRKISYMYNIDNNGEMNN